PEKAEGPSDVTKVVVPAMPRSLGTPIGVRRLGTPVVEFTRHNVPSPGEATQTARRSAATAVGVTPTATGFAVLLPTGSIRTTSPAREGTVVLEPPVDRIAAATAPAATRATAPAIKTIRRHADVRLAAPSTPSASRRSATSSRHDEYRAF